jgi:peptidoglycan/xylan/chitin deacetylase (PgdA/CDA1 family)
MKIKYLFFVALSLCSSQIVNGQHNPKVVFRYDDYALIPSEINDSITNIFIENKIPLCLGVIPFDTANSLIFNLNRQQLNDLKLKIQTGKIEIALHGYNHKNQLGIPFFAHKSFSEFADVNRGTQYEKLAKGKRTLDSLLQINTNIFVPPFNTYDKNTLKVLEDLHFDIISGSMSGPSLRNNIKYIPATCENFSELPGIISRFRNRNVTIVVYFHGYSFNEVSSQYSNTTRALITFRQLDALLKRVKQQNVSFYSFSDLAGTADYNYSLYRANSFKYNLLKKVLNKTRYYNFGVYSSRELNQKDKALMYGNILLHLLCLVVVYLFVSWLTRIFNADLKTVLIIFGMFFLSALIFLFYIRNDFSFWMILIIIAVVVVAASAGIFRVYKLKP